MWNNILDNRVGDPSKSFRARSGERLGCLGCPLNGHTKLKGLDAIEGKSAMLWALNPTRNEVDKGKLLIDTAGKFIWSELALVGFKRSMFDLQYVVRCQPAKKLSQMREPDPKELKHCSVYNDEAVERNEHKAKLHLIFGKIAQQQLLGDDYAADTPVFWSDILDARVVCLADPHYFIHGAPTWRLEQFRERLRAAWFFYENPSRWHFLKKVCDLKLVETRAQVDEFFGELETLGKRRVALDIEDGIVDGKRQVLTIAASFKRYRSRCLPVAHPEADPKIYQYRLDKLRAFLGNPRIKKAFQYGPYDTEQLDKLLDVRTRGYDFDTSYAHYLKYTFLRSHGLHAIAGEAYPMFNDYKTMVNHSALAEESLKTVALYNNADAALTKIIELDFGKEISEPLMRTYIAAGITLYRMQQRGPLYDKVYGEYVRSFLPVAVKRLIKELQLLTGDRDFNPRANQQVAYHMKKRFKLKWPEGEKPGSTGESVLNIMIQENDKHPFLVKMLEFRNLAGKDKFLEQYANSADKNQGELRTLWFLTGAVTGRLRSGGGKDKSRGLINMQNLHGDLLLQNLLVSDVNWREVEKHI